MPEIFMPEIFTPEIVRCNGEPGMIRNMVIAMPVDELPLVKVTPIEFGMVPSPASAGPRRACTSRFRRKWTLCSASPGFRPCLPHC